MEQPNILIGAALTLLTLASSAYLGYRALTQKAEDHDLQELKTSVQYRVEGMQRELDMQAREMIVLRSEVAQCARERLLWQEEKNRLLMQLLEARLRRGGGQSGGLPQTENDV